MTGGAVASLRRAVRRGIAAGGLAALVLSTVACDQAAEKPNPLRLAVNPWPGYEFLFLARDLGYFEDEGLAVELVERRDLGTVATAFMKGEADAMTSTLTEVLQACDTGPRCPRVVLAADYSDGADVLMALPPLKSPADLRGRRVAVESGTATMFLLSRALEAANLSFADVTVVQMEQHDMTVALQANRVDAVISYPPVALELARSGRLRTIFSSADVPGEVVDVVSIDPAWLEERPEDAAALVRAWDRAVLWWRENPGEAVARMAAREGVSVREFEESLARMEVLRSVEQRFLFVDGGPLDRAVRKHDRLLRRAGLITGPNRSAEVVVGSYLQTALRKE